MLELKEVRQQIAIVLQKENWRCSPGRFISDVRGGPPLDSGGASPGDDLIVENGRRRTEIQQRAVSFWCLRRTPVGRWLRLRRRVNPVTALKEKLEALDRIKARCLSKKECNFPTEKSFPKDKEPPVDMFSKGLKENAPSSPHHENEMKHVARSQWPVSNQFQCGGDQKMSFILPKVNRSLDIR